MLCDRLNEFRFACRFFLNRQQFKQFFEIVYGVKGEAFFEGVEVGGASGCHESGQSMGQGLIQIYSI